MSASKLIRPDPAYRDSYLAALDEFHAEGQLLFEDRIKLAQDFESYVRSITPDDHMPTRPLPDWAEPVPETIFWLVKDGIYLGTLVLRHRLNWHLEKYGGSISYIIRPTARHKGFGQKILKRGLMAAQSMGIAKVLLTCTPDNDASRSVIESIGGTMHDEVGATDSHPAQLRYWIDLE